MAPHEKLAAYLSPPLEMTPGVAAHYATVCRACPAGCGLLVKTREKRPIKLEGNPLHPTNSGALCARGQAFIQGLYSKHRASRPLVRQGGRLVETSWKTALNKVASGLRAAGPMGLLTGLESGTFEDLVSHLTTGFSGLKQVSLEPVSMTSMARAVQLLWGTREVPRVDLSRVNHLVSLGADFLDAWLSPVELSRQWAEAHGFAGGRKLQMDYVGPRRNLTAIAADRSYLAQPQVAGKVALALLHGLYAKKRASLPVAEAAAVGKAIKMLGPAPEDAGLSPALIKQMVDRLASARAGLVLFGGAEVSSRESTAVHAAALLASRLAGGLAGLRFGGGYALSRADPQSRTMSLLDEAASGRRDVLLIHGTNPVLSLPGGFAAASKLARAKLVVCLAHELDETTEAADVVLPVHHPLESWGDYHVSSDVAGLMQPVRAPLYRTRHAGDLLMELARAAGKPLPHKTYKEMLVARWTTMAGQAPPPAPVPTPAPTAPNNEGKDAAPVAKPAPKLAPRRMTLARWEEMLAAGGLFETPPDRPLPRVQIRGAKLPRFTGKNDTGAGAYHLVVPLTGLLYDGRESRRSWLREVPDSILQTAWEIPVELPPDVAGKHGISDGDMVWLEAGGKAKVRVRAAVTDGVAPGCVALRPGGGRTASRTPGGATGAMALLSAVTDPLSGELAYSQVRVNLSRDTGGNLVSVSGGEDSEGRLLALSISLADARAGRYPVITRHGQVFPDKQGKVHGHAVPLPHQEKGGTSPKDNMYELQAHPKHRWGIVVDLDKCTGCGACSVACYAENNVPVVGRQEVARGRELSWIRIEKHTFGEGAARQTQFLPVMCQQCDNAPCETVCPVFASYHTADGLNGQVYNRCIGTRYCSNNCPYKARRFNYFDYQRDEPARQQLNPDVTVRPRGVMEKCTFCIQRIREVLNRTKVSGAPIKEGDILPACVQTCPTGAMSFGDYKRPDWTMSKLARDPRAYRLLDYMVNTRPGVVYLRKVRTTGERSKK